MTRRSPRPAVTLLLALALLTACGPDDQATPSPTPTGPYPVAQIAPLEPADPTPGPYDDHPAVQVYRQTKTVIAWANLTNDAHIAQVTQYIDPASEPGLIGMHHFLDTYEWVKLGPSPTVIESVTDNPDGTTTLRTCGPHTPEVSKLTGEPRERHGQDTGSIAEITLSPLTATELAELADLGLDAPPLRIRHYASVTGDCDASTATVQQFTDWQDHAPIGDYGVPDPWAVRVQDEDGTTTYRDRDDMP